MSVYLERLNPAQRAAVEHSEGPLLIVAGAGTGKTRVVTARVARLVERGIPADRILAITFTNKAAREMRERVDHWLPGSRVWVSTFHAFAARILRQDGEAVGLPRDFGIMDRDDQSALVRRLLKQHEVPTSRATRPSAVLESLLRLKAERAREESGGDAPGRIGGGFEDPSTAFVAAQLLEEYEASQRAAHLVDFDDLLVLGERLLAHPVAGVRWRERFLHVLVDEYQDTNALQCRLVDHLTAHGNLAVCGDPDQSIYSWRGADVQHILRFEEDHPGARVVRLEANYRSTGPILRVASAVIRHNQERIERELVPSEPREGPRPRFLLASGDVQEAHEVVSEIADLLHQGDVRPVDVAILYRTHALSRPFESALRSAGIPYRLLGAVAFYARKEIKDLLAYLRLRVQPFDSEAFVRAVSSPPRGVGEKGQLAILERAAELGRSLVDVVLDPTAWPPLRGSGGKGLQRFASELEEWMREPEDDFVALTRSLIDRLDYDDHLDSLGADGADRKENVKALLADLHDFQERDPHASLRDYLERRALVQDGDTPPSGVSGEVQMMTLHSAKGLEFPVVFLCGLEEDILPHRRGAAEGSIEEERRLFYVGLTRAQRRLVLSAAAQRFQFGRTEPAVLSRFLHEIPEELLQFERAGDAFAPRSGGVSFEPDEDFGDEPYLELDAEPRAEFESGDEVLHQRFGIGRVVEVFGLGARARLRVRFDVGERVLSASFANLRRVRRDEY